MGGCRWLTASLELGDSLLNACALEFVLHLQELIYAALVPYRSKRDTVRTLIMPMRGKRGATTFMFLGGFFWACVSASWVILYLYVFEDVLPSYLWDVRAVCYEFLSVRSAV